MKINALGYVKSVILAIALLLVTDTPARSQDNIGSIDNSVINGLFTPTASQRFFEAGRDDFERETRVMKDSGRYFDGDILEINPEVTKQMKQNRSSLRLWIVEPPQQLHLEPK
jgi:hypothetical protein